MLRQYTPNTGNCPSSNPDGTGMGSGAGPCILTSQQIIDLETRNPSLLAELNALQTMGTLSQGMSYSDPVYGNILFTQDANGNLVVDANSPVNPATINQPAYTSPPLPPGSCNYQVFGICLDSLVSTLQSGIGLIGIGLAIWFMSTRK